MEIANTQFIHSVQGLQGPHRNLGVQNAPSTAQQNVLQDEVRFSDDALRMSETTRSEESSSAGIRFDLVNRIKSEIAAGSYDTPDKMEVALDRMIERMLPR